MLVVMVSAMLLGSTAAMLAGSLVLVVVATACAATARRSPHGAAHAGVQCLDLWAMALGMLALVHPDTAGSSAHVHEVLAAPGWLVYLVVVTAWAVGRTLPARVRVMLTDVRAVPAMVTGLGLVVMPILM
jgi:hypothetical protein